MRRTGLLLAVGALAVAAPADALAAKSFEGTTEQKNPATGKSRSVMLTVGDDNLLDRLRINWITRRCKLSRSRFQHFTAFRKPYDESTPDAFRDRGRFKVVDRGGIRSRVRIRLSGRRSLSNPADPATERWTGTLAARVVVRRRGKVIDRCRLRQITWQADLVVP